MATNEEQLRKLYEGQLTSQKEQLATDYESALSDLDRQKQANQQATDENLRRAVVDAERAQMNNEEYYAASGLSSGAKAQARLAQGNQLQANMTALRTAQQNADAETERQRGLLSKEYESAIRKAQADNDLALAQALYEEAQRQEANLLAQQEAAAKAAAAQPKYTIPSAEELELWEERFANAKTPKDAQYIASLMAAMEYPSSLYNPMYAEFERKYYNRPTQKVGNKVSSGIANFANQIKSVFQ